MDRSSAAVHQQYSLQTSTIGQAAEIVDGHERGGQGELPALRAGGQQRPYPSVAAGVEHGLQAAVALAGLGHALDGFKEASAR
ncbi:hypothetical protein ABT040_18905 [Streptomyces sp. NPDC002688]|uniref:hypothetical protein n=1 Tax=Streptomyces sp. NPDC002688 TaxID=3154423 RepID=UPI00331D51E8